MKVFSYMLLIAMFFSCASSQKTAKESNPKELIGENEMLVLKELGTPTQILRTRNGKVLVYENHADGAFLTPNRSNFSLGNAGWTFTSNVNKEANKSQYTIHSQAFSVLRVYINEKGVCVNIERAPMQEYGEKYHERFKHFNSR